jgi:hypothetical protein
MLGELNFHSKPQWFDWTGSAVIVGAVMFATALVVAV